MKLTTTIFPSKKIKRTFLGLAFFFGMMLSVSALHAQASTSISNPGANSHQGHQNISAPSNTNITNPGDPPVRSDKSRTIVAIENLIAKFFPNYQSHREGARESAIKFRD